MIFSFVKGAACSTCLALDMVKIRGQMFLQVDAKKESLSGSSLLDYISLLTHFFVLKCDFGVERGVYHALVV